MKDDLNNQLQMAVSKVHKHVMLLIIVDIKKKNRLLTALTVKNLWVNITVSLKMTGTLY